MGREGRESKSRNVYGKNVGINSHKNLVPLSLSLSSTFFAVIKKKGNKMMMKVSNIYGRILKASHSRYSVKKVKKVKIFILSPLFPSFTVYPTFTTMFLFPSSFPLPRRRGKSLKR